MEKIVMVASVRKSKAAMVTNGEIDKSTLILETLKTKYHVKEINVISKKTRIFKMLELAFYCMFRRPTTIFISKSPGGCSRIAGFLRKIGVPKDKIMLYSVGCGVKGFENKKYLKNLKYCRTLICESPDVISDFQKIGVENIQVFPCLKKQYNITQPKFEQKETLNLIFWARIVEQKGLFKAINAIIRLNKNSKGKPLFRLSIAGPESSLTDKSKAIQFAKENPDEIFYFGSSFMANGEEAYKKLSEYDLNIFPTTFIYECIPGSIIDNMIAGVPTVSTRFIGSEHMLSDNESYFFENVSDNAIDETLMYIYHHQAELYSKRFKCIEKSRQYTESHFLEFISALIKNN